MRKPGSKGLETLRNLHSAAIDLLAERSYQGMNLRLLASKLGMQAGSLYNYIESKQQLLFWLMKDTTEKLLHGFERTIAEIAEPTAQMREFIALSNNCNASTPTRSRRLSSVAPPPACSKFPTRASRRFC